MAGLKKRNGTYYIKFKKTIDGYKKEKTFSLGVSRKRDAERMRVEYQEKYEQGEIDPFDGWTPSKEAEKRREESREGYILLHEAASKFLEERYQANQVSLNNYQRHLDMLKHFLGTQMPVGKIKEKDIRNFCFRTDLRPATQASYLRHIKVFFKWLVDSGIISQQNNPTAKLKPPKKTNNIREKIITEVQLHELFEVFDNHIKKVKENDTIYSDKQFRPWFKPMIAMYFYTGLRAKEGVNLTWKNVDLKEGVIYVTNDDNESTKSGNERAVPYPSALQPYLDDWAKTRDKLEGYVFPSANGLNEWHPMGTGSLSKTFKKFARMANFSEAVTLHGLRHSCATFLLSHNVPIVKVARYLGHSSVQVTQIYEHLTEGDLKETIKKIL